MILIEITKMGCRTIKFSRFTHLEQSALLLLVIISLLQTSLEPLRKDMNLPLPYVANVVALDPPFPFRPETLANLVADGLFCDCLYEEEEWSAGQMSVGDSMEWTVATALTDCNLSLGHLWCIPTAVNVKHNMNTLCLNIDDIHDLSSPFLFYLLV